MEQVIAVAIRDGKELFLWIRIRRTSAGDIYYIFPTGRNDSEWKKWNPHGSFHKDGHFHHKSFGQEISREQKQKPDADFKGTLNMITRPISSEEPRGFGVRCDPTEFSTVMEIPIGLISAKKYETYVSIDLTEPGGAPSPNTSDGVVLAQRVFDDAVPSILVSLVFKTSPRAP